MKLVKDLGHNSAIINYWINSSGEKISPEIPCVTLAEEWRTKYLFSTYEKEERRRSIIDRRRDKEKRGHLDATILGLSLNSNGRRITEGPVKVDIDLSEDKIKEITTRYT